jgi:hypothetical protein
METLPTPEGAHNRGIVLILIKDLFFSVAVRNAVRSLGFDSQLVKSPDVFADSLSAVDPCLCIVDLHTVDDEVDWDSIREAVDRAVPVIVFGPHRDVDGMRAAKAAGVTRVISNGQFHAEMGAIIERYARAKRECVPLNDDGDDNPLTLGSLPPGMADPIAQPIDGEFASRG